MWLALVEWRCKKLGVEVFDFGDLYMKVNRGRLDSPGVEVIKLIKTLGKKQGTEVQVNIQVIFYVFFIPNNTTNIWVWLMTDRARNVWYLKDVPSKSAYHMIKSLLLASWFWRDAAVNMIHLLKLIANCPTKIGVSTPQNGNQKKRLPTINFQLRAVSSWEFLRVPPQWALN